MNPKRKVFIVGCGEDLPNLKSESKKYKNIFFIGECNEIQKIEFLKRAKLFIFPPPNEPLGVVIMEAIYCGTKVLAFNKGGPSEIIRHNIDGFLANNVKEFLDFANKFIPNEFFKKASDEKKYIKDNFDQTTMVNSMLSKWIS